MDKLRFGASINATPHPPPGDSLQVDLELVEPPFPKRTKRTCMTAWLRPAAKVQLGIAVRLDGVEGLWSVVGVSRQVRL